MTYWREVMLLEWVAQTLFLNHINLAKSLKNKMITSFEILSIKSNGLSIPARCIYIFGIMTGFLFVRNRPRHPEIFFEAKMMDALIKLIAVAFVVGAFWQLKYAN
jgi:hypothetical protein